MLCNDQFSHGLCVKCYLIVGWISVLNNQSLFAQILFVYFLITKNASLDKTVSATPLKLKAELFVLFININISYRNKLDYRLKTTTELL